MNDSFAAPSAISVPRPVDEPGHSTRGPRHGRRFDGPIGRVRDRNPMHRRGERLCQFRRWRTGRAGGRRGDGRDDAGTGWRTTAPDRQADRSDRDHGHRRNRHLGVAVHDREPPRQAEHRAPLSGDFRGGEDRLEHPVGRPRHGLARVEVGEPAFELVVGVHAVRPSRRLPTSARRPRGPRGAHQSRSAAGTWRSRRGFRAHRPPRSATGRRRSAGSGSFAERR